MSIPIVKQFLACISILLFSHEISAKAWHQYKMNQSVSAWTIVDPCLGATWEIVRIPQHPEWPARMMLISVVGQTTLHDDTQLSSPHNAAKSAPIAVIRAGDRVLVNQDQPNLHAKLEGYALGSASVGQPLLVRLSSRSDTTTVDRGIISVYATGEGRAVWDSSTRPVAGWGVQP